MKTPEINGVANIVTFIDMHRAAHIGEDLPYAPLLEKIRQEAMDTMAYMAHLDNRTGVMWHEIKQRSEK